jgi:hypothetical protein
VTEAELGALAGKYRALVELHRAAARGEPRPPAAFFRELARDFPGCLRELDTLPTDVLLARAAAVARAAEGGPVEAWMPIVSEYHARLREALACRAGRTEGVEPAFAQAAQKPPGGRLNPLVFADLARRHGTSTEAIARLVFPGPR